MKLKKNHLMMAGLFVASFAVINIGMHFFLRLTQPKVGPRRTEVVAKLKGVDSTAAIAMRKDSVLKSTPDTTATPILPVNLASISDTTTPPVAQAPAVDTAAQSVAQNTPSDVSATVETDQATADLEAAGNLDEIAPATETIEDTREMAKLAKLMETMKPADAASIAARLDEDQIIALVMRMKDRTGGKMLAALPVEQAARVATRMSQMTTRTRTGL
jgi:flagellar motility protein MotE (MotC chaperone)